ncbi:MAG: hypothetical protein Q8M31_01245 [Beijerinckiaceae bacterium]|nr:hypothetical protein [Beijerinckiaceae bacterium]
MRSINAILLSAIAAAAAFVFVADAEAQTRRERGTVVRTTTAPPLTIRQRSFLDPGPIVAPRTMHNYVSIDTAWRQPVFDNQRGRMGVETLPRRFDPPGRASPLFEF